MTGYTASAFLAGCTAADTKGTLAHDAHATAAAPRSVRHAQFPLSFISTAVTFKGNMQ